MQEVIQIHPDDVKKIEWAGNNSVYDQQLCKLGAGHESFLIVNPWLDNPSLTDYIEDIPETGKCVIWGYNGNWVAKYFNSYWTPDIGYEVIELVSWNRNPALGDDMTFEYDPTGIFEPQKWDREYQLVWYIDPRVNPTPDKIWAVSFGPTGDNVLGIKDMGYLMPKINIEYNSDLPDLGIDINQCYPAFWELVDVCAWELDPVHTPYQRMWAVKFSADYKNTDAWKWYGTITPDQHAKYNSTLPKLNYEIDYIIPWHDLEYEHIWYLDHDFGAKEQPWVVRMCAVEHPIGTKKMDYITPIFPDLDVIFISYYETNAEANWQRVLEKAPHAKRVNGVKGIFEAHQAAAKLATTDMFYVVDGDAYLEDDMDFNYQPTIFDRECTHIWRAKNPINGLVYGYGGVKLFSTSVMLQATSWVTLDLSTSVISKIKIIDKVSNVTAFDTDALAVWRSAFRECVKLCYNIIHNPKDRASKSRLQQWLANGIDHTFGKYAIDAAQCAVEWANTNKDDYDKLRMINQREWIEEQFKLRNPND